MSEYVLYISGWAEHGGKPGLSLFSFNEATGEMKKLRDIDTELSMGASIVNEEKNLLYVDNETSVLPGEFTGGGGQIVTYQIDRTTGDLTELDRTPTFCPNPAWPELDATKKYLAVANHSGFGTATKLVEKPEGGYTYELIFDDSVINLFRLKDDGTIDELVDVARHDVATGTRALHSHPHCFVQAPGKNLYAVCEKGECRIYFYRIDYENERLVRLPNPYQLPEGSAPRYLVFHPTLPLFYINQERNMDVCVFSYNDEGEMELIQTVTTLPADYQNPDGELCEQQGFVIDRDGKFLYSVLNGPNSIAVFSVAEDGKLTLIQNAKVDGEWPRAGRLSPNGSFFLAGCLVSGDLISYHVGDDGKLTDSGHRANMKGASYITFYEKKGRD